MIDLLQSIPPRARAVIYCVYVVLVFIAGGIQVAYAQSSAGQPQWLTVAIAVLAYAGGAMGLTAAANATSLRPRRTPRQPH